MAAREPFERFVGDLIVSLLTDARRHYPYATISFDGGGQIRIDTGMVLDGVRILIPTGLYEAEGGRCSE